MNPLTLLPALMAIVQARPQSGYDYPAPSVGPLNLDNGYTSGSSTSSLFSSGSRPGFSQVKGTTVTKHIYVHVPPPDPEEQQQRHYPQFQAPQKHYKIIFIKAPSAAAASHVAPIIQPQSQEKTLIYVLVKKPEDPADIQIPEIVQRQPSKPEVYFIRYKSRKGVGNNGPLDNGIGSAQGPSFADPSSSGGGLPAQLSGNPHHSGSSISSFFPGNGLQSSGSKPSSSYGPPGHSSGGPY